MPWVMLAEGGGGREIERPALFESPFTDLNHESLYGFFDEGQAGVIVGVLEQVAANAAFPGVA